MNPPPHPHFTVQWFPSPSFERLRNGTLLGEDVGVG